MAALGWLLNLGFAAGGQVTPPAPDPTPVDDGAGAGYKRRKKKRRSTEQETPWIRTVPPPGLEPEPTETPNESQPSTNPPDKPEASVGATPLAALPEPLLAGRVELPQKVIETVAIQAPSVQPILVDNRLQEEDEILLTIIKMFV